MNAASFRVIYAFILPNEENTRTVVGVIQTVSCSQTINLIMASFWLICKKKQQLVNKTHMPIQQSYNYVRKRNISRFQLNIGTDIDNLQFISIYQQLRSWTYQYSEQNHIQCIHDKNIYPMFFFLLISNTNPLF